MKIEVSIEDTDYRLWLIWAVNRYAATLDEDGFKEKFAAADSDSKRSAVSIAWLFAHYDRGIAIDRQALALVCSALFDHLGEGTINPFRFEWIKEQAATPRERQIAWQDTACRCVFSALMFGGDRIGAALEFAAEATGKEIGTVRKAWEGKAGKKYREAIAATNLVKQTEQPAAVKVKK